MAKTIKIFLRDVPEDVADILFEAQAKIKKRSRCQIGMERIVYKFIRANKNLIIDGE